MSLYKTFETERLILKPTTTEDAAFVLELLNTPKWLKYIGDRKVHTLSEAKLYIETKMLPQLKRLGFANYTVIRKTNQEKIGSCGLYDREGVEGVDIGFAFLPQYEKQGYAFEAAGKVKNMAFNNFGLTEIYAITTKENSSSQKLLEKLGLKFKKVTNIPGDDEDLLLYKLKNK
ncbi:GNAT family N-acetyltransferase [Aestuariibaculum marinum]|uniref:GNAT family N-acetyltransferase n=1 Tax=Aestuariibaculum marinum TaxID=2683592 RepID=A0A8J6Q6Y3_9FLAO|nr:GNAT family N-acetyltransferase [Aestuariibaculum marinum]MBD0822726.1 GNAT family N-acetyltransferase [Aestuariibaculum marinum]